MWRGPGDPRAAGPSGKPSPPAQLWVRWRHTTARSPPSLTLLLAPVWVSEARPAGVDVAPTQGQHGTHARGCSGPTRHHSHREDSLSSASPGPLCSHASHCILFSTWQFFFHFPPICPNHYFYFFDILYHLTVLPPSRRSERNVQPQALIWQRRTWMEFT